MSTFPRQGYELELRRTAKNLELSARGNLENRIIDACKNRLAGWVAAHGSPNTLTKLMEIVATSLSVRFVEIHDDRDLINLLEEIPPSVEPIMARLHEELNDETDGILIQRTRKEAWEPAYLAVINCRGWHAYRAYFTKWHELAHLITDGKQMAFAFRKTKVPYLRKEPVEILVDKVAGELGFNDELFVPVFKDELSRSGRLSFDLADDVRNRLAPEASRHATLLACLRHYPDPCIFIQCQAAYKRREERIIQSGQKRLPIAGLGLPEPKLRVKNASTSPSAASLELRIHKNMRVPLESIVADAWNDISKQRLGGSEKIEFWETSASGPIGSGDFYIEAQRIDGEVWAIIHVHPNRQQ